MDENVIIVSNRLPFSLKNSNETVTLSQSSGGLVSGLKALYEQDNCAWVGWLDERELPADRALRASALQQLHDCRCVPVSIEADVAARYYEGMSNACIWPLFHNFPQLVQRDPLDWEAYVAVNQAFCDRLCDLVKPGDVVWIHDYHLMLLPAMLRRRNPGLRIGFFLHIPFPPVETYRMLPWRAEVLEGLTGADLIGFHTNDYVENFIACCRGIAGAQEEHGLVSLGGRTFAVDAFPLGINFEGFKEAIESDEVQDIVRQVKRGNGEDCKMLLSVERLDYSKGIPDRLRAFDLFLEENPEWCEHVTLVMISVPSREEVESYRLLKEEIECLVGRINGKYSSLEWSPVKYYYRSVPYDSLCAVYAASDVMLVTPLSDGMNLVCKEYLACHEQGDGILVLSETAGAASELTDALLVNPFDCEDIKDAIGRALSMDEAETRRRGTRMLRQLEQNTSQAWADTFCTALGSACRREPGAAPLPVGVHVAEEIVADYAASRKRAILLDYDGTLVSLKQHPSEAAPDPGVAKLIAQLGADPRNHVVIISGRDRRTMESWFGGWPVDLVAEHGVWTKRAHSGTWNMGQPLKGGWKKPISRVLDEIVQRFPGSFVEEKDCSLAWHYRTCSRPISQAMLVEVHSLLERVAGAGLMVLVGDKVMEIKSNEVDKGCAATEWLSNPTYDFVLVAGDDTTDEDMFDRAPKDAWTIKVGDAPTAARFTIANSDEMRTVLGRLALLRVPAAKA